MTSTEAGELPRALCRGDGADVLARREVEQPLDGLGAEASLREVYDPDKRASVSWVVDNAEIGEDVFYLLSLKELVGANDAVRDAGEAEGLLEGARLSASPEEDADVTRRVALLSPHAVDLGRHVRGLSAWIFARDHLGQCAITTRCPELLRLALCVLSNHRVGAGQHVTR